VALGISDGGIADVDHLMRTLSLFELIGAGHAHDDGRDQRLIAELKTLRRAMLMEVRQLHLPRLRLYVRFRTPEDSLAVLDYLKAEIKDIDPKELPNGLKFEQGDESIAAKFSLADEFPTDEGMAEFLGVMNLTEADDPAFSREMVAAAQKFKAEASIRRSGDSLLLTFGPADAGGAAGLPAGVTQLPQEVGNAGADTLVWARWNNRPLKEAARGWIAMHEQWAKSTSFSHLVAREEGDETLLDVLRSFGLECLKLGDSGSARIWADPGDSAIRLAMREENKSPAKELAHGRLATWLPADVEAYSADTTIGLGEYLSNMLSQFEGRLSLQSLRGLFQGDDGNAAPAELIASSYYTHFNALRELIHNKSRHDFERGVVAVLGTHGRVERLEASFIVQGHATRLSMRNLPSAEFALLGRPKAADEAAVKKYMEDLYGALATGISSAARSPQEAGKPIQPMRTDAQLVELGLGVPTWGFDPKTLSRVTGEAKLNISVEGDLHPHFFVVDGTLVFSTSPRLSKALLEAHNGKTPRLLLPPDDSGVVVSCGKASGEAMARTVEHMGAWFSEFMNHLDRAGRPADANKREESEKMFAVVAQIFRLVERIEWRTAQTPEGRPAHVTRGAIYFEDKK
jgi:hypothetical protein